MKKGKTLYHECFTEFLGVMLLCFFGAGSVTAYLVFRTIPSYWEMSLLWGMAITFAIYVGGGVSGAHINPAVTLPAAIFYGFPWRKVPSYIISQIAGGFTGAALAYSFFGVFISRFEAENGIVRGTADSVLTASIFSTYPREGLTMLHALWVEIVITAVLVGVIFACIDQKNPISPKGGLAALIIGILVATIGGSFGPLTGFAMNPARDLGPKLFVSLAGWGNIGVPAPGMYFLIPVIGPMIGGVAGAFVYRFFVETAFEEEVKEQQDVAAKPVSA